jgi:hypothetical protein
MQDPQPALNYGCSDPCQGYVVQATRTVHSRDVLAGVPQALPPCVLCVCPFHQESCQGMAVGPTVGFGLDNTQNPLSDLLSAGPD